MIGDHMKVHGEVQQAKPTPRLPGWLISSIVSSGSPLPTRLWVADLERHEALFYRVEVKGLHLRVVAAARTKLRAA